jgi:hypothetical protein
VVVQFDGTTPTGVRLTDGYGGAWILRFEDVEIFADSTAVNDVGILVEQISVVGAFILDLNGCTINGSATNVLSKGVRMVNDSLSLSSYHCEYVVDCVAMEGVGFLKGEFIQGSSNSVTSLVDLDSAWTGGLVMSLCQRNGATNFLKDNRTGGYGTITGFDHPQLVIGKDSQSIYSENTAKAWCVFDGTDSDPITPSNSFNVSSVTKTATGNYRVNLTRPLANSNAVMFASSNTATDSTHVATNIAGVSTFDVRHYVAGVLTDANEIKAIVFGV